MVSEDSQKLGWFSMIHRLSNLGDFNETINGQMPSLVHEIDDRRELVEVCALRGS